LHIYFRACEKQQAISNVMRFQNINKTEMLKRCWLSIQSSVTDSDTIIIIHDEVSEDTLKWLHKTSNTSNISFVEVEKHEWNYHLHTVTAIDILAEQCIKFPDELHYLVEDDYLHTANAIWVLENSLLQWQHFAVSYDYPDRYRDGYEPALVMLGVDRHWRTVQSATMTVLAKGSTWLRHIETLRAVAPTSNDAIFREIFKQDACISPLPGVASHMTDYHMTPLVDWVSIWEMQTI